MGFLGALNNCPSSVHALCTPSFSRRRRFLNYDNQHTAFTFLQLSRVARVCARSRVQKFACLRLFLQQQQKCSLQNTIQQKRCKSCNLKSAIQWHAQSGLFSAPAAGECFDDNAATMPSHAKLLLFRDNIIIVCKLCECSWAAAVCVCVCVCLTLISIE